MSNPLFDAIQSSANEQVWIPSLTGCVVCLEIYRIVFISLLLSVGQPYADKARFHQPRARQLDPEHKLADCWDFGPWKAAKDCDPLERMMNFLLPHDSPYFQFHPLLLLLSKYPLNNTPKNKKQQSQVLCPFRFRSHKHPGGWETERAFCAFLLFMVHVNVQKPCVLKILCFWTSQVQCVLGICCDLQGFVS